MSHVFGPVPSRRLGLSLGVDVVTFKTCSLNCVYCQLGRTTKLTIERREYVPVREVLADLREKLAQLERVDYVTFSGSGEPTLHSGLGELIAGAKEISPAPVAVLTNGTLLWMPEVRRDLARADLVVPSLDAGSPEVFRKVNRPAPGLDFGKVVEGLVEFRRGFAGQLDLEVMMVAGLNDSPEEVARMKEIIARIAPDRVQVNTVVRPPAEGWAAPLSPERLQEVARELYSRSEVIAEFARDVDSGYTGDVARAVLEMISRRPVSADEISATLGVHPAELVKYLDHLHQEGRIVGTRRGGKLYYELRRE